MRGLLVWMASGCGWPQFADADDGTGLPSQGPVTLIWWGDEAETGDRPDWPQDLGPLVSVLEEPFTGLLWEGQLGWEPVVTGGATDFACDIAPLPVTYLGDVDFVRFAHTGGTVCISVATPLAAVPPEQRDPRFGCSGGDPLWDALIYPLVATEEDEACVTGTLQTPSASPERPLALGERPGLLLPWLAPGEYAVALAPLCGEYALAPPCDGTTSSVNAASCVPYALSAAIVSGQAACDDLHDQLLAYLDAPSRGAASLPASLPTP